MKNDQSLVLQRKFMWQHFADKAMEEKFREEYWVKNMRHALNVILTIFLLTVALVSCEFVFENLEAYWSHDVCRYPRSRISRRFLLALSCMMIVPNVILRQTWTRWRRYWRIVDGVFLLILVVMCLLFVLNNIFPFSPSCACVRGEGGSSALQECPSIDKSCFSRGYVAWETRRSEIDCSIFGATANQVQIIYLLFLPRLIPTFKFVHLSWLYFVPWFAVVVLIPCFSGHCGQDSIYIYVQKALLSFGWLVSANAIAINHKFMLEKSQRKQFSSGLQDSAVLLQLLDILRYMLPPHILHRQLANPHDIIADHIDVASILFCCVENFDVHVKRLSPPKLLEFLNGCFTEFDELCQDFNVSKIETVGEVYVCAVGLTPTDLLSGKNGHQGNLKRLLLVAQEMLALQSADVTFKIGLHTGPIVAGVVGTKLPRYRLFGDTINTAARMEQKGFSGKVNFSAETLKFLPPEFAYTLQGAVEMKGKGQVDVYVLQTPDCDSAHEASPRCPKLQDSQVLSRGVVSHLMRKSSQLGNFVSALRSHTRLLGRQGSRVNQCCSSEALKYERFRNPQPLQSMTDFARDTELLTRSADSIRNTFSEPLLEKSLSSRELRDDVDADCALQDVIVEVVKHEPNVQYQYRQNTCCTPRNTWFSIGKRMRFKNSVKENEFQRWYHEKFVISKIDKRLRMHILVMILLTCFEATWNCTFPVTSPHQIWGLRRMAAFLVLRSLSIILTGIWWYISVFRKRFLGRPLYVQRALTLSLATVALLLFLSTDALHPYFPGVHYQHKYEPSLDDGDLPYESVRTASYFLQFAIITSQYRLLFRHTLLFVPLALVIILCSTLHCFCVYIYLVSKAAFLCSALLCAFVAHSLEHMNRKRFARDQSTKLTHSRVEGTIMTLMPPGVMTELRAMRSSMRMRRGTDQSMQTFQDGRSREREATRFFLPSISHTYHAVTILQADLVGFTKLASMKSPAEVLTIVGDLFAVFDVLTDEHKVYKLETVGDAYIAVQGGQPLTESNDPLPVLQLAMAMVWHISAWARRKAGRGDELLGSIDCRVGVHHGPVVGGIVGQDMQRYHLFGKTMHALELLESTSLPGEIHVSLACKEAVECDMFPRQQTTFQQRQVRYLTTSKGDIVHFEDVGGKTFFLENAGAAP